MWNSKICHAHSKEELKDFLTAFLILFLKAVIPGTTVTTTCGKGCKSGLTEVPGNFVTDFIEARISRVGFSPGCNLVLPFIFVQNAEQAGISLSLCSDVNNDVAVESHEAGHVLFLLCSVSGHVHHGRGVAHSVRKVVFHFKQQKDVECVPGLTVLFQDKAQSFMCSCPLYQDKA